MRVAVKTEDKKKTILIAFCLCDACSTDFCEDKWVNHSYCFRWQEINLHDSPTIITILDSPSNTTSGLLMCIGYKYVFHWICHVARALYVCVAAGCVADRVTLSPPTNSAELTQLGVMLCRRNIRTGKSEPFVMFISFADTTTKSCVNRQDNRLASMNWKAQSVLSHSLWPPSTYAMDKKLNSYSATIVCYNNIYVFFFIRSNFPIHLHDRSGAAEWKMNYWNLFSLSLAIRWPIRFTNA